MAALTNFLGQKPVDGQEKDDNGHPSQEGDANLHIEKVEGNGKLHRQTPATVKTLPEVEHPVCVCAHEVDDLARGELVPLRCVYLLHFSVY